MHRLMGCASLLCGVFAMAGMLSGCDDSKVKVQPGKSGVMGTVVSASTGNDSNDGTPATPYKTITHALSLALPGTVVVVLPGTYDAANGETFPVVVPAGVMLIGDEPNKGMGAPQTLISGSGIIPLTALSGTITAGIGSTVAGFNVTGSVDALIYLAASNVTIRNNTVTGTGEGIYVNSSNNLIAGNMVQGNPGDGLLIQNGTGTRIENNTFTANFYGVNFSVAGGDLGGGSTGSVGGNRLYCNNSADLVTVIAAPLFAQHNGWDHVAPTRSTAASNGGIDRYDPNLIIDTTGAFQVATPCVNFYTVSAAFGNDTNLGTPAQPFRTITHALSITGSGDSIQAQPGNYNSNNGEIFPLNIPGGVSLIGDEPNKGTGVTPTLVSGPTAFMPGPGSTLAGFAITGGGISIYVLAATNNVTIRNNTVTGSGSGDGIYVDNSSNLAISGNILQGNSSGDGLVFVGGGTGTKVQNNVFRGNWLGVELDVPAADLGGGAAGSVGGNQFTCNTGADLWTGLATTVFARNNGWDHNAPTLSTAIYSGGVDRYDPNLVVDTAGAVTVPLPCVNFYTVSAATGNDGNIGSSAAPFQTITHALAVAVPGDLIQVQPGNYDAINGEIFPITLPARVSLIGDEPNKGMGVPATLISGDGLVNGVSGGAIKAGTGATIAGFQLIDAVGTFIAYLDANGVELRNNSLPGPSSANAIYISSSSNHVITGNFEQNNTRGLGIVGTSSGTRIENNTFRGNAYGVEFDVNGGDLGGGPTGSVGGNFIYCNTVNDFWTNIGGPPFIFAQQNGWDHYPQTFGSGGGQDINDPAGAVVPSGGFQVAGNCP